MINQYYHDKFIKYRDKIEKLGGYQGSYEPIIKDFINKYQGKYTQGINNFDNSYVGITESDYRSALIKTINKLLLRRNYPRPDLQILIILSNENGMYNNAIFSHLSAHALRKIRPNPKLQQ